MSDTGPALNPAQEEILALLGAAREDRPEFDGGLRAELRGQLEEALAPVAALLGEHFEGETLHVSKYPLARVHGCEGFFLASEEEPFAWTPSLAKGRVVHKAVELAVNWRGEPVPRDMVDEAIARLTDDASNLGDWLQTCSEADEAELRAAATELMSSFWESFPPLQARWWPVTESRLRAELFDGAIALSGRSDLTLGKPDGLVAGKVIIDLKTGTRRAEHIDDLRFYALLETLVRGTPPRLLATAYLDQGRAHTEQVTTAVLRAALRRTIEGVALIAELRTGTRQPELRPSPSCRWCPIAATCEPGSAWLAEHDG